MRSAIALARKMILDGTMPTPQEAYQQLQGREALQKLQKADPVPAQSPTH